MTTIGKRLLFATALAVLFAPALAVAAPFAYVVSWTVPSTVSVIDTANNSVVATVPSSGRGHIAANAAGTRVYVAAYEGLSIIDTATNAVVGKVPFDSYGLIQGVAVNPQGTRAYVPVGESGMGGDYSVSVIDLTTGTDLGVLPFGDYSPVGIALNPAGSRMYVPVHGATDEVWVLDTTTYAVEARIAVPAGVGKVAMDPAGARLYVVAYQTLSIIDTATGAIVATRHLVGVGVGVAVNAAGTRVYLPTGPNSLSVLDATTLDVVATVTVGTGPIAVAADPTGTRVYITNLDSNDVSVVDMATNKVVATIPVAAPFGVAVIAAVPAPNYQGLWWASGGTEAFWGINMAHSGDQVFATWYTYDATGKAWWLSMLARKNAGGTYAGPIHANTGPPFNNFPLNNFMSSGAPMTVGNGTLTFIDANNGTFHYDLNANSGGNAVPVSQTKTLARYDLFTGPQVSCVFDPAANLALAANYQDVWWAASGTEDGWGINLAHQGDSVFLTWFTYDVGGAPLWLSALTQRVGATSVYTGNLLRTSGPRFDNYKTSDVVQPIPTVGTATLTFVNGNSATFNYTTNGSGGLPAGVNQTKAIVRFPFGAGGTVCQ